MLGRLGRRARQTALATPSAARAGSGGSSEEMMKTSVHLIRQLQTTPVRPQSILTLSPPVLSHVWAGVDPKTRDPVHGFPVYDTFNTNIDCLVLVNPGDPHNLLHII